MTWIILLLQIIPGLINTIAAIIKLLRSGKLTAREKMAYRSKLMKLARTHVRKKRADAKGAKADEPVYQLVHDEHETTTAFTALELEIAKAIKAKR